MLCVGVRVAIRRQQKVLICGRGSSSRKILIRSYHMNCRSTRMFAVMKGSKFGLKRGGVNVLLRTNRRCFSSGLGFKIHPAIGISRLGNADIGTGNSDTSFYDEPTTIGGLPTLPSSNGKTPVTTYRNNDSEPKKVLRQAAVFKICDSNGDPITNLASAGIDKIEWSVWLANKKSAFYEFREFQGYPLLSSYWTNYEVDHTIDDPPKSNSYVDLGTERRNSKWYPNGEDQPAEEINGTDANDPRRQKLIIDFGPRTCICSESEPDKNELIKHFNDDTDYAFVSHPTKYVSDTGVSNSEKFPWVHEGKSDITELGYMEVDPTDGTLRVVGGSGDTCGKTDVNSFAGAPLWWDDISDGPVKAVVKYTNGNEETLTAWCMVGSPKYAPELVNISTMDDVIYDAAVRYNSEFRSPRMVREEDNKFILGEDGFWPVFKRDIKPIFDRMKNYQWVANVGAMVAFANPPFDISKTYENSSISKEDKSKRLQWFKLLREAFPIESTEEEHAKQVVYPLAETRDSRQTLFSDSKPHEPDDTLHFPLMPLNSGDNSVMDNSDKHTNQIISKFASVTPTQYYFLYQWANGCVVGDEPSDTDDDEIKKRSQLFDSDNFNGGNYKLNSLDRASTGNCVGYPTSPGIETTWNIRVPWIYQSDDPYRILYDPNIFDNLLNTGLEALRDECHVDIEWNDAKINKSNKSNKRNVKLVGKMNKNLISEDFNDHVPLKVVGYDKTGILKESEIEGAGLQPGDLTKRMAIPWQADFSNCSVQPINFTDVTKVQSKHKPAYYAYWWPPQAPWNVYLGYETETEQEQPDGEKDPTWGRFGELGSGQQVFYQRGIMEHDIYKTTSSVYVEMIKHWQDLGFIINTTASKDDELNKEYPYFVEKERNSNQFEAINIYVVGKPVK